MFYTFSGKKALYEQLYTKIKDDILNSVLKAGERLPSKRKLSSELKISVVTVEKAYEQLIAEGYIYSVAKRGYFVCEVGNFGKIPQKPLTYEEKRTYEKRYKYDFSTSTVDTDYFPFSTWARLMREVITDKGRELLRKPDYNGTFELRQEIARYLFDFKGIRVLPDNIVVGAGSEYLMNMIIQLLGYEKHYGMENPGYRKIKKIFDCSGINASMINVDSDGIDINQIYQKNVDVIHITPSHHFPLGTIMPIKRRLELLKWAEEKSGFIIEDDYDSEFRHIGKPIPPMKALDGGDNVIYLDTFAKKLAPSIRVSYMVLPEKLCRIYEKKLKFYSPTVSSFEQYTLAAFMHKGHFERYINKMRQIYKQRSECILRCIEGSSLKNKITVSGNYTGLHLVMTVNNNMTETELISSALESDIFFSGISDYYDNNTLAPKSTIIAGYSGISEENIKKAFEVLEKIW